MHVDVLGFGIELDASFVAEDEGELRRQLREYEAGERERFDLTLWLPESFSGDVWRAVREVEYGETRTYGAIARELDTAPIAVGNANANNPLPIVVPCHRLVGADSSLRGYRYPGMKARLIEHEAGASLAALGFEAETSATSSPRK